MIEKLTNSMNDKLRVIASRAAGLIVGSLCTYLLVRYRLDIPEEVRTLFVELIASAFVGGIGYLATHFAIAARVNPDDAANPDAAAAGKAKQRQRKAVRATEERIRQAGLWRAVDEPPEELPIDRGE
jgi:hypothetical protein